MINKQWRILSIGVAMCGPVLAAPEKCTYKVTNCVVNDSIKGYLTVKSFNASDGGHTIHYKRKSMDVKGEQRTMGCSESQCDTRIAVTWNGKRTTLWRNDACEDLWIDGSPEKPDQIKVVTTRACVNELGG